MPNPTTRTPPLGSDPFVQNGRFSWHKQEILKGDDDIGEDDDVGTDCAGWGFSSPKIMPDNPICFDRNVLKTNTVFRLYPLSMNTNKMSRLEIDEHLAKGIPALSPAVGCCRVGLFGRTYEINLQTFVGADEWWSPLDNDLKNRWLHSDLKDVAYFYVYRFFEEIVQNGGLK